MRALKVVVAAAAVAAMLGAIPAAGAAPVPGQQSRYDQDDNGFPDAGQVVTGHQTDPNYFGCVLHEAYRGDFNNDPYLDSGWIVNTYNCGNGEIYGETIVHR